MGCLWESESLDRHPLPWQWDLYMIWSPLLTSQSCDIQGSNVTTSNSVGTHLDWIPSEWCQSSEVVRCTANIDRIQCRHIKATVCKQLHLIEVNVSIWNAGRVPPQTEPTVGDACHLQSHWSRGNWAQGQNWMSPTSSTTCTQYIATHTHSCIFVHLHAQISACYICLHHLHVTDTQVSSCMKYIPWPTHIGLDHTVHMHTVEAWTLCFCCEPHSKHTAQEHY